MSLWRGGAIYYLLCCSFLICLTAATRAQVNILTYHNDLSRTGLNPNETQLTPWNVNTNTFGKLFSYEVDGQVYAQPLYVSGLNIPGRGTRNVVFVATQHNSVYAFDADLGSSEGALIWHVNLGPSAATPNDDFGNRLGPFYAISPEVGITGTPVIDLTNGCLFVDAFTHEEGIYVHKLHSLDITSGAERPNSPVTIAASFPGVGLGSVAGQIQFEAKQHIQRAALTLAKGVVFVAFAGYADTNPYHGWIIGFDASSLRLLRNYVYNLSPNGTFAQYGELAGKAGVWMSGGGFCVDAQTNIFLAVGNGVFNADQAGGTEFGDTVLKLSTVNGLSVASYFAPYNQLELVTGDVDLGSGGLVLLPDTDGSSAHPHLLVSCGKQGTIYLLDRDNLGGYTPFANSQIVQELTGAIGPGFSTPAYYNHRLYYQGVGDVLKRFAIKDGRLEESPSSRSLKSFGYPGATPAISANETTNGIVWVLETSSYVGGNSVLHAYDAEDLTRELYNSSQDDVRDNAGGAVKFTVPTIANGKVYVGGRSTVSVFGNASFLSSPKILPALRSFTNSVLVSFSVASPDTQLRFTLDGTTPDEQSQLYTKPVLITNATKVQVRAFKAGYIPSPLTTAVFRPVAGNYEPAVLALGPFAYWRLNESVIDQAYDTANAFDGVYESASIPNQSGPQAPLFPGFEAENRAVQFNEQSGFACVTIPPLNLNSSTITIIAWVYPNGPQWPYSALFVKYGSLFSAQLGAMITFDNNIGYTWNYDTAWEFESGLSIPTNQWSLVAVAIEPSKATVYLANQNGLSSATNPIPHMAEMWRDKAQIGDGQGEPSRTFIGAIDEVAVFDRTLFGGDIASLYAAAVGSLNKPKIEANPPPATHFYEGQNSFLQASVSGSRPLSYQWRKDGIPLSDDGRIVGSSSSTLTFCLAKPGDAGVYDLVISNAAGTAISTGCAVSVNPLPDEGYAAAILSRRPLAYWRFNETEGAVARDETGCFSSQYGQTSVRGRSGPSGVDFPGLAETNKAVAMGEEQSWITTPALNLTTNTWTFTAWIFLDTNQLDYTGLLMSRYQVDAIGFGFTTSNQLGYAWNVNSPTTWGWNSGLKVPTNQWCFVALVVEPERAAMYLSQSNRLVSSINPIEHQKETFAAFGWIGDDFGQASTAFVGAIDEVAVFAYAMDAEQLQSLYNAARLPRLDFLVQDGELVLKWKVGNLLTADSLDGPWVPVPVARPPYTAGRLDKSRFYKLVLNNP